MSEQKPSYMQQLDEWSQQSVLEPLYEAWKAVENAPDGDVAEDCQQYLTNVVLQVKKAIREKVLESYRNGQRTPARPRQNPARRFAPHREQ